MASSSANNVEMNAGIHVTATTDFWNDETTEITSNTLKQKVPPIPQISNLLSTYNGGGIETLAYCALQMSKTSNKKHIMRVMATATAWLLETPDNLTGSRIKPITLKGLDRAGDDDADENELLVTNMEEAEDVTVGELLHVMTADSDEIGAYFGVLFLAGNKRVDRKNRSAFNEKRKSAATASITKEPIIFVPDSPFLTMDALSHVYAAFLSYTPIKTVLTSRVVEVIDRDWSGAALAFMNQFALLSNSGLSALGIIKEATLKHHWIRDEFPELQPEYAAANNAFKILKGIPAKERPFIKAIHGNNFQPVAYNLIDNLTGVCKKILQRTTPSYENYGGGRTTDKQLEIIARHTDATSSLSVPVAAE